MKSLVEIENKLGELQSKKEEVYEKMMSHPDLEKSAHLHKMVDDFSQKIEVLKWIIS